jgi:membrane protease YdiL (CAAX protease family)
MLYVETGSLLLPIILHAIIDLRPVLLPKLSAHPAAAPITP